MSNINIEPESISSIMDALIEDTKPVASSYSDKKYEHNISLFKEVCEWVWYRIEESLKFRYSPNDNDRRIANEVHNASGDLSFMFDVELNDKDAVMMLADLGYRKITECENIYENHSKGTHAEGLYANGFKCSLCGYESMMNGNEYFFCPKCSSKIRKTHN